VAVDDVVGDRLEAVDPLTLASARARVGEDAGAARLPLGGEPVEQRLVDGGEVPPPVVLDELVDLVFVDDLEDSPDVEHHCPDRYRTTLPRDAGPAHWRRAPAPAYCRGTEGPSCAAIRDDAVPGECKRADQGSAPEPGPHVD
jgi:hypothetical protein